MGIASTGQYCAQIVQPVQSVLIEYLTNAVHFFAGQRP
jgi:hypothetical protein